MREPDDWIKQNTILTPFLCQIANASSEDAKHILHMALNKFVRKVLTEVGFLIGGIILIIVLIGLCNIITSIYKPTNVECVDVSFVSPTIDSQRQDFVRKKILGIHVNLVWFDNDIRLEMHRKNGTSESIIFSKVSENTYLHNGIYDNKIYLNVQRNILGWITHIDLDFFDYEGNQYTLLYRVKLK